MKSINLVTPNTHCCRKIDANYYSCCCCHYYYYYYFLYGFAEQQNFDDLNGQV